MAQIPPPQEKVIVICVSVSLLVPDPSATKDLQSDVENIDGISELLAILLKVIKSHVVLPPIHSVAVLQKINVYEADNIAKYLAGIKIKIDETVPVSATQYSPIPSLLLLYLKQLHQPMVIIVDI